MLSARDGDCFTLLCATTTYRCDDLTVVSWGETTGSEESFFDAEGTLVARYFGVDSGSCVDEGIWQGEPITCGSCTEDGAVVGHDRNSTLSYVGCPPLE